MKYTQFLLFSSVLFFALLSCSDSTKEIPTETQNIPVPTDETEFEAAETYIASVDEGQFTTAKSLYYSRPDGASVEVELFLNDSSQIVKMIQLYTDNAESSLLTKKFYYRDGKKYATKEYFEDKNEDGIFFVERVSYYDEKGKPSVTKKRTAPFEDALVDSQFELTDKFDCSDERCFQVLNQEGEYATTFQGFVKQQHLSYLIVGEDKKDGYASSLVVQFKSPVIVELEAKERAMIGTPLEVDFQTAKGDMGFDFQALTSIKFVK